MRYECIFFYYDTPDILGRITPKEIAIDIVKQFKNKISPLDNWDTSFYGITEETFSTSAINVTNISHRIIEMHLNENKKCVEGIFETIQTPIGENVDKLLKPWIEAELELPLVCRPVGNVKINEKGKIEEFELQSFNLIPKYKDVFNNIEAGHNFLK